MTSLLPWLRLMRLPAVFSALADVLLGCALVQGGWEPLGPLVALLVSTAGLYLGGMVLNDVADIEEDRRDRPSRPIPSGAISWRSAQIYGCALLIVGVCAAGLAAFLLQRPALDTRLSPVETRAAGSAAVTFAGLMPGLVAAAIAVCVLLYTFVVPRRNPAGTVLLGACRMLNVLLGASIGGAALMSPVVLLVAGAFGLYIVGVGLFARDEAATGNRTTLIGGLVVADTALVLLGVLFWTYPGRGDALTATVLLALVALSPQRHALRALASPSPKTMQVAVQSLLTTYVLFSATAVFWHVGGGVMPGLVAAMVLPAAALGRLIRMT